MKKKSLCLLLSVFMLLVCVMTGFTGCSTAKKDQEDEGEVTDTSAKTITMWVMTSDETTEKAKTLVSEAFTKITKSLYKTNVVLKFCTEDEYYDKLESSIKALQADVLLEEEASKQLRMYLRAHKGEKPNAELTKDFYAENPQYAKFQNTDDDEENEEATEEETVVNEYGIVETKYPEPKENQVDIFYISGYDKYMQYYNSEWLASLSEELSAGSRKLMSYVAPALLNGVQIDGGVYAIPNNVPIGEYTYMMIDKALFDEYYNKIEDVTSVVDLATFLNDMKSRNLAAGKTAEDEGYVVPLASTFEECLKMLVWYWDLGYDDLSVYNTYYDAERDRNYVLTEQYTTEITEEKTDANGNVTETKKRVTRTATSVVGNMIYKTDDDGNYVDKNGQILNYHYERDAEGGWLKTTKGELMYTDTLSGAMYLVDENGDTVTKENDKRVILTSAVEQEPDRDENGGFLRDEEGNLIYVDKLDKDGNPVPATHEGHDYIWDEDVSTAFDADGNYKPTYSYYYDDESIFSVLGTMKVNPASRTRGGINLDFKSLFTDKSYRELYTILMNYTYEEYFGEVKEGQTAAVSFVKGDARIKQVYEEKGIYTDPDSGKEYYVVIAEYPEASEEDLYGNMYAVYGASAYLSRAMEVITRLNTNTELRNLLQYGILGQHYELNDDGTVHLLTSSEDDYGIYRMDIAKTGNCFIATPMETDGPDAWTYAKIQNNDSLINPLLGFDFNTMMAESEYPLDTALINYIDDLNKATLAEINDCADLNSLKDLLENDDYGYKTNFNPTVLKNEKFTKAVNGAYDPEAPLGPEVDGQEPDASGASPFTVYKQWLTQYGYAATTTSTDSDKK